MRISSAPWPTTLKVLKKTRCLAVEFDDGFRFDYAAEYLRVESPSAEVFGHGSSQKRIIPGCKNINIAAIEPIGNYAIRIIFDDHHSTGIYSWTYLYELAERYRENWQRYLMLLKNLGLTRE